jgi:hypothetical protein
LNHTHISKGTLDVSLKRTREGITLFTEPLYLISDITGIAWGMILIVIYALTNIKLDLMQWFVATLFIGSVMQFSFFGFKKKRYRRLLKNEDLLALFEEVKVEIDKDLGIELWFRDTEKNVILSTANPLFKAILVSDSAIADILRRRKEGKIALAREVLRIESTSFIREFAMALFLFTDLSLFMSYALLDFIGFIVNLLSLFSIGAALVLILIIVGIILALFLDNSRISRNNRRIEENLRTIYSSS